MRNRDACWIPAITVATLVFVHFAPADACQKNEYLVAGSCVDCTNLQRAIDRTKELRARKDDLEKDIAKLKAEDEKGRNDFNAATSQRDASEKQRIEYAKQIANVEGELNRPSGQQKLAKQQEWLDLQEKLESVLKDLRAAEKQKDLLNKEHRARSSDIANRQAAVERVDKEIGQGISEYRKSCGPCQEGLERDATGECKDPCAGDFKRPPGKTGVGVCR